MSGFLAKGRSFECVRGCPTTMRHPLLHISQEVVCLYLARCRLRRLHADCSDERSGAQDGRKEVIDILHARW